MKIAIGTKNPAKLNAIASGIDACVYLEKENIELISESVESGVSDMPKSLEENITGAKNRAENLIKKGIQADLYIGMEGGTSIIGETAYLFGVIYIIDGEGEGHLGISPMMEVPKFFKKGIYENGEELGPILEKATGVIGASKKNGAFGAWSDDMLTRSDQFELAFICAITPFYNKYYTI